MKQPPAIRLICCCCPWPASKQDAYQRDTERALPQLSSQLAQSRERVIAEDDPFKDDNIVPVPARHEAADTSLSKKPVPVAELESPVAERSRGRPEHSARTTSDDSSLANNAINTALRFPSPPRRSTETQQTLEEREERERDAPPPSYENAMAEK